jgi:putative membrane protein
VRVRHNICGMDKSGNDMAEEREDQGSALKDLPEENHAKGAFHRGRAAQIGAVIALLAGSSISVALIAYYSFNTVGRAVWRIGWGLVLIVIAHLTAVICCGVAWRILFHRNRAPEAKLLILLRWIRESVNTLLPVARVGGDIVGVRLLVTRGCEVNLASASVVADRTVEVLSLLLFALTGVLLLLVRGGKGDFAHLAILGVIATLAVLVVLFAAQRWGLLRLVEKAVQKLAGKCCAVPGNGNKGIHEIVWSMYGDYRRLAVATFLHAIGWILGVVQIWVALYLMGHETGWAQVFIIESLSQVTCTAAFIMPAALGAQEAAYMVAAGFFGIPPELGLALSLVKRLSDVLSGIPGLLVWQGFEGRLLWSLLKG